MNLGLDETLNFDKTDFRNFFGNENDVEKKEEKENNETEKEEHSTLKSIKNIRKRFEQEKLKISMKN